jgi:hypothetical protein
MKKMMCFAILLAITLRFVHGQPLNIPFLPKSETLYPPTNLIAINVEQQVFVEWNKPVTPSGQTPPGLLGYYIYRNGVNIFYINDPDDAFYYDYHLDPGIYIYKTTAYYDLTPYGKPGQFAESCFSNSDTVQGGCACFFLWEPWDQASFDYNEWHFYPSQGNWNISVAEGNPLPAAVFGPNPVLYDFDYSLISRPTWSEFICAKYTVDFDLKMEAAVPGDSARLFFELYYDSTWFTKAVFSNTNTDGWIHYTYDVSEATGIFYKIRFRATGDSSSVIGSWMIDNILLDFSCLAPDSLQYDLTETQVNLFWNQPCRKADTIVYPYGFNVFRTDSTGQPPYYKLNETPIPDTFYVDPIHESMLNGEFRYCMEIVYNECTSDTSASILVSIPVGTGELPETDRFNLGQNLPNPCSASTVIQFTLQQPDHVSLKLFDLNGRIVMDILNNQVPGGDQKITVNTSQMDPGVYYYTLKTSTGKQTKKMVVVK